MSWINLNALWKILVVGMLCGAGLPAIFAIGLWALNLGRKPATVSATTGAANATSEKDESILGGSSGGMVLGALCFLIVLAGIGMGIYYIVSGS